MMTTNHSRTWTALAALLLAAGLTGCLPQVTSEELNRQLALARQQSEREKEELRAQLNAARAQATTVEVMRVRVETVERESAALVARVGELEGRTSTMERRASELEAERARLAAENAELVRLRDEAAALSATAREAEERAAALERERDEVRRELQRFIDLGGIGVDVTPDGVRISLRDAILFDSGKDELKPGAAELLAKVAQVVGQSRAREIRIAGHTDNVPIRANPKFPSNWELSTSRALAVVHRLVDEHRLPARRLVALGFGENRPVAGNETAEGRARNRRVEIFLVPEVAAR